jgi:hypothetical protein
MTLMLVSVDRVVRIFWVFKIMADHDAAGELQLSSVVAGSIVCAKENGCSPQR